MLGRTFLDRTNKAKYRRRGEISQIKMIIPSLLKNKSYYMNFKHINMSYMPLYVIHLISSSSIVCFYISSV